MKVTSAYKKPFPKVVTIRDFPAGTKGVELVQTGANRPQAASLTGCVTADSFWVSAGE